ncbi:MAG: hypothetical protein IT165_05690 [Bryobacterales bacterium]|nr:hypothetical protein [Bryobacterales bacterium]
MHQIGRRVAHQIVRIAGGTAGPASKPLAGIVVAGMGTDAEVVLADVNVFAQALGTKHSTSRNTGRGFFGSGFGTSRWNAPRIQATYLPPIFRFRVLIV